MLNQVSSIGKPPKTIPTTLKPKADKPTFKPPTKSRIPAAISNVFKYLTPFRLAESGLAGAGGSLYPLCPEIKPLCQLVNVYTLV